ncbi:MAG: TOBE domain-containing protein [Pseudomonadota bacterium]
MPSSWQATARTRAFVSPIGMKSAPNRGGPCREPGRIRLAVRPENMDLRAPQEPGLSGTIRQIIPLGPVTQFLIDLSDGASAIVSYPGRPDRFGSGLALGTQVAVGIKPDAPCSVFAA